MELHTCTHWLTYWKTPASVGLTLSPIRNIKVHLLWLVYVHSSYLIVRASLLYTGQFTVLTRRGAPRGEIMLQNVFWPGTYLAILGSVYIAVRTDHDKHEPHNDWVHLMFPTTDCRRTCLPLACPHWLWQPCLLWSSEFARPVSGHIQQWYCMHSKKSETWPSWGQILCSCSGEVFSELQIV